MKRYLVQTMPMHDARIEEYINLHSTTNGFELHEAKPFMDEQSLEMSCLITMCREEEHPQQKLSLDKRDTIEESNAMLQTEKPKPWEHLSWEECAITFAQNYAKEGYDVEIADSNGIFIKTWVALYEWSGYVTPFINAKDIPGLVAYLIELNRIDRREDTYIRSEEWL